jgi:hypothetical protein
MPTIAPPDVTATARHMSGRSLVELVRGAAAERSALWVRVTGKSMNPIVREGDAVLLVPPFPSPRRGEVVFIDSQTGPLLHRVAAITGGMILTRGDACGTDDPPHPVHSCIAHAAAVRRGGTVIALTPRVYLGLGPLVRYVAWRLRLSAPIASSVRMLRSMVHGQYGTAR